MGHAFQSIAGFFTAAAAGTGAATVSPGDNTFNISQYNNGKAYLNQVWASGASTDFVRVRSPRMHDPNVGIKVFTGGTLRRRLLPWELSQPMFSGDIPTVEIDETAIATGGIVLEYEYDDLPGSAPVLDTWESVKSRIVNIMGTEVDVTSGAIGAWGVSAALNTPTDNFKAAAYYAVLGYTVNVACLAVSILGPDTSGLRQAVPGDTDPAQTQDWFIKKDRFSNAPSIPIIAGNNRLATACAAVDTAAATAVKITWILAQLGS